MPKTRKITFSQLGQFLQRAWEMGLIGQDVHDLIEAGKLPIRQLRDKLKCVIERSDEEGYLNFTQL
jgi:hypothetical protein